MKEKEINLTVEELDYLLKGTLHWEDIAWRGATPLRKPLEQQTIFNLHPKAYPKELKQESQEDQNYHTSSSYAGNSSQEVAMEAAPFPKKRVFEDKWPLDKDIFEDDSLDSLEPEEEELFWSGTKVYVLLSLVGVITLGTWFYFVFA